MRLRLLNAANARNFDLRFSDRRPFFVIAGDAGYLSEPVEVRRLVIAPAERFELLVDFSDGRPVELVAAPDTHGGMGPGMMMQMGRPRGSVGETQPLVFFKPDPKLHAGIRRLPAGLTALPSPDIESVVAWRTFVLNPMMGMMGMEHGGMRTEWARPMGA